MVLRVKPVFQWILYLDKILHAWGILLSSTIPDFKYVCQKNHAPSAEMQVVMWQHSNGVLPLKRKKRRKTGNHSVHVFLRCISAKQQHVGNTSFLRAGVHKKTFNHFMALISFSQCQVYKSSVFNFGRWQIFASPIKYHLGSGGEKATDVW